MTRTGADGTAAAATGSPASRAAAPRTLAAATTGSPASRAAAPRTPAAATTDSPASRAAAPRTPALADVHATWLLPVVPPMVSAATGAALVAHLPAGQAQLTLLLACYALFGLSLVASFLVIGLLTARLVIHGTGPKQMVPTLWMVLGPLGQSITAVNLLGAAAGGVTPYAGALQTFGIVYGVPVAGFALLWLGIALATTIQARPPFHLTWWSFTFPLGTLVTGTSQLAIHTGADALTVLGIVLFAGLVTAWIVVFARTAKLA